MKRVKGLLALLLTGVLLFSMSTFAYAKSVNSEAVISEEKLEKAYENVINYAYANAIPLDLSLDTFLEEFKASKTLDIAEYENTYYSILTTRQPAILPNSSGGSKWYYNTGTTLPHSANYSKYKLLDSVKKGDIIYESKGGFGITGHTAIVEGK